MDNNLVEHKWVRLLADSCADGVWARDGCSGLADDLPVSAQLILRIRAWQAWYDRDEDDWGLFKGDVEAFSNEGREIARALKAELPDWTVVYFDKAASERHPDGPRTHFEYEIVDRHDAPT